MSGQKKPMPPSSAGGDKSAACATTSCPNQICPGKDNGEIQKALDEQKKMLQAKKKELETWDDGAKASFKKWFGSTDEDARKQIQGRIDKMIELNGNTTMDSLKKADPQKDGRFAYVHPDDKAYSIYLDKAFCSAANTGQDSRAGTLCHEMSHFEDVGGTEDHVYGAANAKELAKTDPPKALTNADSFEYYMENLK